MSSDINDQKAVVISIFSFLEPSITITISPFKRIFSSFMIDNIFEIDFFSRKKYPRSGSDNLRLELGGKYKYSLNTSVSLFTRVATGKEYRPNDNYSYWNIENGIKSRINSHLDGIFSLRFRDSYNQNKWRAFDRTYRAGLIYKASEIVSINLNYNHARGEIQFDGVGLNIKVNF